MFKTGTLNNQPFPLPVWSAEDGGTGGTPDGGTPAGGGETGTPVEQPAGNGGVSDANGSGTDLFATLEDKDTREWLEKVGVTDIPSLARKAREQERLLGSAIRVPGKDATDEERQAYLNKLGRPETPDAYDFAVPPDLPEDLPYDGERASAFKSKAHELGLTAAQAANLHDWFVGETVKDFNGLSGQQAEQIAQKAQAETEKLVKIWGPLDGEAARTELEFADRALQLAGGEEAIEEFKAFGLIAADGKTILSAHLAQTFANIGKALFKEDTVLRGNPDMLGNPFAEGESFNLTKAMAIYKSDKSHAYSLIAATGKKPADFGLPDR